MADQPATGFSRRRMLAGMGAATATAAVALSPATAQAAPRPGPADGWVGTWGTAPADAVANTPNGYPNYSIRNTLHASIGGRAARVRLSNAFGATPVVFGHVTIALATGPNTPAARPGSLRDLTFGGQRSITVPNGGEVLSDPAELAIPTGADLLVTTYVPSPSGPVTYHPDAQQNSFFATDGDVTDNVDGTAFTQTTQVWHYLNEVDVLAPTALGSIVAFGDSITDGYQSTFGANHRWPDFLAARIAREPAHAQFGVLNAGIGGNRLLLDDGGDFGPNALSRFDRDVLAKTGARTMIVLLGINDIQQTPNQTDPNQIIAAHRQLISQARVRGLRALGGTITPFQGWTDYSPTLEATRAAVNSWIRTGGGYDGVVDFDAAIRDPADPQAMLAGYDSGDHLHPDDAGYQAMANAIPLRLL
ncbi:MAG TPA: SGNH/GDSL hydrolase family protein [Pseudonocardiaceae bacterium]|jgi:lysophospholipase L1-like esterase|nr:SGNH/GDSL hydrolase family protein [Pseudonocardiaceae bacterium]